MRARFTAAEVVVLLARVSDGVVTREALEGALVVVANRVGVGDLGLGAVGVVLASFGLVGTDALVALSNSTARAAEIALSPFVAETAI